MTERSPIPACLSHLTQRDAEVRARALEEAAGVAQDVHDKEDTRGFATYAEQHDRTGICLGALRCRDEIDALISMPSAASPDKASLKLGSIGAYVLKAGRSHYVTERPNPTPPAPDEAPIDMILHCPKCGMLHEDMPSGDWTNPPHKSHLCRVEDGGCGTIWRPADVATNGVRKIKSKSQHDTWEVADHVALASDEAAIRAELVAALRAMEAGR